MKLLNQYCKIEWDIYNKDKFNEPRFHIPQDVLNMQYGAGQIKEPIEINKRIQSYPIQTNPYNKNKIKDLLIQAFEEKSTESKIAIQESGGMIEDNPSFVPKTWMLGMVID